MQLDQVTFTSSFVRKCLETEIHLVYTKLLLMMVKVIHHLIPAGSVLPAVSSIALLQVTRQTDVMTIAVEGYRRLTRRSETRDGQLLGGTKSLSKASQIPLGATQMMERVHASVHSIATELSTPAIILKGLDVLMVPLIGPGSASVSAVWTEAKQ
jgi:hypothetical protein